MNLTFTWDQNHQKNIGVKLYQPFQIWKQTFDLRYNRPSFTMAISERVKTKAKASSHIPIRHSSSSQQQQHSHLQQQQQSRCFICGSRIGRGNQTSLNIEERMDKLISVSQTVEHSSTIISDILSRILNETVNINRNCISI